MIECLKMSFEGHLFFFVGFEFVGEVGGGVVLEFDLDLACGGALVGEGEGEGGLVGEYEVGGGHFGFSD